MKTAPATESPPVPSDLLEMEPPFCWLGFRAENHAVLASALTARRNHVGDLCIKHRQQRQQERQRN
jgi:predicted CoA-binding protein